MATKQNMYKKKKYLVKSDKKANQSIPNYSSKKAQKTE